MILKAKLLALGEWYSCRGLVLVANSGVSSLGFKLPNDLVFVAYY